MYSSTISFLYFFAQVNGFIELILDNSDGKTLLMI